MSRIFMYAHGGSGNHGCEAIVRSTARIFAGHQLFLISSKPEEDEQYGISQIAAIFKDADNIIPRASLDFLKAYAALKLQKDFIPMEKLRYKCAFDHIQKGDVALSIGGDNYCYADAYKYTMFHEMAKQRGAKTVLWGCSVDPALVKNAAIARDLSQYDAIAARETISYEALLSVNPNTYLVADPAFVLEPQTTPLPAGFVLGSTVGINLSPMVMDREVVSGIAFEAYCSLIRYIIESTDMQIALIPHVVWPDGDDRIPLKKLLDKFSDTGRVVMVEERGCQELKCLISQCRFFIGARTHATIAAYSSCVPTLVLGYSVKSRGIARDLFGTEENYVLPVQELTDPSDLLERFNWLLSHEQQIRDHLTKTIPQYSTRAYAAKEAIDRILP